MSDPGGDVRFIRQCEECGGPILRGPRSDRVDRFCSRDCELAWRRKQRSLIPPRICTICGDEYRILDRQPPVDFARRKTCSRPECTYAARLAMIAPKECPECGITFRATNEKQVYCCRGCMRAANAKRTDVTSVQAPIEQAKRMRRGASALPVGYRYQDITMADVEMWR